MNEPQDWIVGSKASYWGRWRPEWPVELLKEIQEWGDAHCCRFLLVSEHNAAFAGRAESKDYYLALYVAPKPNSLNTGLCPLSVENRDRNFPKFSPWFEGFLAGKGIMRPKFGDSLP